MKAVKYVFLCAENRDILEVSTLVKGLIQLMAAYYVYKVCNIQICAKLLSTDKSGPAKARATRYKCVFNKSWSVVTLYDFH